MAINMDMKPYLSFPQRCSTPKGDLLPWPNLTGPSFISEIRTAFKSNHEVEFSVQK